MRAWRVSFAFLLVAFSVRCTPDLDALSKEYGGGIGGIGGRTGGNGGTSGEGGTETTSGGTTAGGKAGAQGGVLGTGGEAGGGGVITQGGSSAEAGHAGAGSGGEAGLGNEGGHGPGGTTGAPEGGQGQAGSGPEGGAGGGGSGTNYPCVDGCGVLYVPFTQSSQKQFFTINLDIANGVDLSKSVLTVKVRPYGFTPSNETIQFYASALPSYAFLGGPTVSVSTLTGGGTINMDLTNTGGWDHTKVMSFGFLVSSASTPTPVWLVLEEVTLTNGGTVGPWLFKQSTDVNESPTVDQSFNTPNILFANAYQRVDGAHAIWAPPSP